MRSNKGNESEKIAIDNATKQEIIPLGGCADQE